LAGDWRRATTSCVELVCANISGFFYVCTLEEGQCVAFLNEVLKQLGGSVAHVGAHERCAFLEHAVKLAVVAFKRFEGFVEERVLYNDEFDVGVVAGTTELGGLFGIEAGSLYKVEAVVCLDGVSYLADDFTFIFLFHCLRCFKGLSLNRFGVDFDARTHGAGKINALDICAFCGCRLEFNQGVDKFAGVVAHLLGTK